jgi:hypothetical protein
MSIHNTRKKKKKKKKNIIFFAVEQKRRQFAMADARHAKAHNNLTQHHKNVPMACEKIDGKHNAKKKKKRKKKSKKKNDEAKGNNRNAGSKRFCRCQANANDLHA